MEAALRTFATMLEANITDRGETLPNFDLEDGTILIDGDRCVA